MMLPMFWRWLFCVFGLLGLLSCSGKAVEGEFQVEETMSLGGLPRDSRMSADWSVNLGVTAMVPFQRSVFELGENQLVAAASDGFIVALDDDTGKEIWRQSVAEDDIAISYSFRRILVSTRAGDVIVLDRDATELWRVTTGRELLAPPVTDGNVVVVHASSGELIALDFLNGEEAWVYRHPQPDLQVRGNSLPVMQDNVIVAGLATGSVAVHQPVTGVQIAQFQIANSTGGNELQQLVDIDYSPLFYRDLMIVGTYQYQLQALDIQKNEIVWSQDFGTPHGMALQDGQLVTVSENQDVILLDAAIGTVLWRVDGLDDYDPYQPLLQGDAVLVPLVEKRRYLVLDRFSGKPQGLVKSPGDLGGSQTLDGSTLYTIGQDGKLTRWTLNF